MEDRIVRIREDIKDLKSFYHISISPTRESRLREYYNSELDFLKQLDFSSFDQHDKIDYLLLKNYLERQLRDLDLQAAMDKKADVLLSSYARKIVQLCENRVRVVPMDAKNAAEELSRVHEEIVQVKGQVGKAQIALDKSSAFRAARIVDELRSNLQEWFRFYKGYDPLFSWWVPAPYTEVESSLCELAAVIRQKMVGIQPDDEDTIVGQPIGRQGLLEELSAEMIDYSPEEIIWIGERERLWCETELKKVSQELGYGNDWHRAMEYVKDQYVEPGKQRELVHDLAWEAIEFVQRHDMVTVPPLAAEAWQMFMMSPERQKINPFFLGGECIQVSYPTGAMSHEDKLMSLRGNNIHFSRATVFHELIPGHHLQLFMNARYCTYRQLFDTPFWIEGWSLYWEMILWDNDRFPKTLENRLGMLFWRLHRCARIVFSIKFHLGQMTPQQCVDFLVRNVGHERATAEGEVRRSLSGEYPPLYQAGYMLGALQIYSLRQELVGSGRMTQKEFHDGILRNNCMPIELLRALLQHQPLSREYRARWKFYEHGL